MENTSSQSSKGTYGLSQKTQTKFDRPVRTADDRAISPKLVGFSENDVRARSFKLLRTTLSRQMSTNGHKIVGITSPSPGAGKSFISSNLAASMCRLSHQNVVLLDLDFQRASIAELFGITEGPDLTEFLIGNAPDIADVAQRIGETGLTVVPSFLGTPNSAELLASARFAEMMNQLRGLGDDVLIICDLPPLFVSDDAILAAQHLDGVILVVEQGVTTKKQVKASLQMLYPAKIYGTIFNRYSGGLTDPYGYSGDYYNYFNKGS